MMLFVTNLLNWKPQTSLIVAITAIRMCAAIITITISSKETLLELNLFLMMTCALKDTLYTPVKLVNLGDPVNQGCEGGNLFDTCLNYRTNSNTWVTWVGNAQV